MKKIFIGIAIVLFFTFLLSVFLINAGATLGTKYPTKQIELPTQDIATLTKVGISAYNVTDYKITYSDKILYKRCLIFQNNNQMCNGFYNPLNVTITQDNINSKLDTIENTLIESKAASLGTQSTQIKSEVIGTGQRTLAVNLSLPGQIIKN